MMSVPQIVGSVDQAVVTALRAEIGGRLLQLVDDGYEQARRIWNGMIDRHPR